jgi:peptide/nickel transport system permease protein
MVRGNKEMANAYRALPGVPALPKKKNAFIEFFVRLVREKPLGTFGGVITAIFLFTAIFCNFLAPYGMNELGVGDSLAPPQAKYLLGTDHLGRDILSRIIFGARLSVIVSLTATSFSIVISVIIGIISGFAGGKIDMAMQRFVDSWMCFPVLIILIVAVTVVGPGMWQIIIVLGLAYGIGGSRIVRSAVISIKENQYLKAAESIGSSTTRILVRHVLPNVMAPVIILFSTRVPTMILVEASLSFLGLGIPPPAPSWGGMLSMEGRRFMLQSPWLAIWPGLAFAIVVYGVNMFGDALRDLLDPRLRGGVGRYS